MEARFDLARITSDRIKYSPIVITETFTQVSDIIQLPPVTKKYQTLKNCLTELKTDSRKKKLCKLLGDLDLGDKKSSMLLHEM